MALSMPDGRFRTCATETLQDVARLVVVYPAHDSMMARKVLFTDQCEAERTLYLFAEELNDNRMQAEKKVPAWRKETVAYLLGLLSSVNLKDNASGILDDCLGQFLTQVRELLSRDRMFRSS